MIARKGSKCSHFKGEPNSANFNLEAYDFIGTKKLFLLRAASLPYFRQAAHEERMDFSAYARWESLALEQETSWMGRRIHYPKTFADDGFPLRLDSLEDLKFLLLSMSCGRFEAFQEELGGFREEDIVAIKAAAKKYCVFFTSMFTYKRFVVPIDELVKEYIKWRACSSLLGSMNKSNPKILEIGPGNGLGSLYLSLLPGNTSYSQVEVTPSLYLIQHWIAKIIYRESFVEQANPVQLPKQNSNQSKCIMEQSETVGHERIISGNLYPLIQHYPWWKIRESFEDLGEIDIVMSHDNIQEMHPIALSQYLNLACKHLKEDGLFFSDSRGASKAFHSIGQGAENIGKAFGEAGFSALCVLQKGTRIGNGGHEKKLWSDKIVLCKSSSLSLIKEKIKLSGLEDMSQFASKIFSTSYAGEGRHMSPEDFAEQCA